MKCSLMVTVHTYIYTYIHRCIHRHTYTYYIYIDTYISIQYVHTSTYINIPYLDTYIQYIHTYISVYLSFVNDNRNLRNPFRRTIPYSLACPEIKDLLAWCGPDLFNDLNSLPWSNNESAFNGIVPTT